MAPRRSDSRRQAGLTLMELLVVMGLITVVSAVALGMMKRRDRALTLEVNAKLVRAVLRQARNSAQASGAGCVIRFDPDRNVIEASPVEAGGNWHFEDESGSRGTVITHSGTIVDGGRMGRYLELSGGSADLGAYPFYAATQGFRFSVWVKPTKESDGVIVLRENSFKLKLDSEGALLGEVQVGDKHEVVAVETRPGLLTPGRWRRVVLSYDRLGVAVEVDGVRYASRKETREMARDLSARLFIGGGGGLSALVDEARYDVVIDGAVDELSAGAEIDPQSVRIVRFDGSGRLDPRFHRTPAMVLVRGEESENEDAEVEPIRIELSGAIR